MDKKETHTKAGSQDNQRFKDNSTLQDRVIELCVKLNQADLLNDLKYFNEMEFLGAYFMLERLNCS